MMGTKQHTKSLLNGITRLAKSENSEREHRLKLLINNFSPLKISELSESLQNSIKLLLKLAYSLGTIEGKAIDRNGNTKGNKNELFKLV